MLMFHCTAFALGLIALSLGVSLVLKCKIHADKGTTICRIFGNIIVILSLLILICICYTSWQASYYMRKCNIAERMLENKNEMMYMNMLEEQRKMHGLMMHNMMRRMQMQDQQQQSMPMTMPQQQPMLHSMQQQPVPQAPVVKTITTSVNSATPSVQSTPSN